MVMGLKRLEGSVDLKLHHEVQVAHRDQSDRIIKQYCSFLAYADDLHEMNAPQFPQQAEPDANVRPFFGQVYH